MHPLLPRVDEALGKLTEASLLLIDAARDADSDRMGLSPLSLIGGPMKYWKWHKAKKKVAEAAVLIAELRTACKEAKDLPPEIDIDMSKLDMVNDLFDVLPFSVGRVGKPGQPSWIKQRLSPEMTVLQQIETARLTVENAQSEVGLLHAKLRAKSAQPAAS